MRKIISLVLVVFMVLGCISFVACGDGDGDGTLPPSGEEEEEENGTPSNGESLEDILGLGAGIESVKYDMIMNAPGMPEVTMEMWIKENKMRAEMTELGETIVMLMDYDEGVAYMYMPDENMAMVIPLTEMPESAIEEAQSIPDYDYTVIRTETLDGKECLVVEYTVEQETAKMWIWKEHGFPIRIEVTTAEGTAIIEFKNIDFGDIDDSMFELPAGVDIMEF